MKGEVVEIPGGAKRGGAKTSSATRGRKDNAAPAVTPEVPQMKLRASVIKNITKVREENKCDDHQCTCTILPPRNPGDKSIHKKWTIDDVTEWAEYLVSFRLTFLLAIDTWDRRMVIQRQHFTDLPLP